MKIKTYIAMLALVFILTSLLATNVYAENGSDKTPTEVNETSEYTNGSDKTPTEVNETSEYTNVGHYDDATLKRALDCAPIIKSDSGEDSGKYRPSLSIINKTLSEALNIIFSSIVKFNSCKDLSENDRRLLAHSILGKYFEYKIYIVGTTIFDIPSTKDSTYELTKIDFKLDELLAVKDKLVYVDVKVDGHEYSNQLSINEHLRKEAQEEAEERAERQKEIEHVKLLQSGKIKPVDFEDYQIVYKAKDGNSFAGRPKIKPDGKMYYLQGQVLKLDNPAHGFIALGSDSLDNEIVFAKQRGRRPPNSDTISFRVNLPQKYYKYFEDNARLRSNFDVIGRYVANTQFLTKHDGSIPIPVFDAVHFELR